MRQVKAMNREYPVIHITMTMIIGIALITLNYTYTTPSIDSHTFSSVIYANSPPDREPISSDAFTVDLPNSLTHKKKIDNKYNSLVLWSSDFHISPIADIKSILEPYGVKIIDKSLSGHCHLTKTCQTDLRIINKDNGIDLGYCPNKLRTEFYNHYRNDEEFMSTDAIICTHAASMCELFMPFNKTLIVIASTRYEIGRYQSAQRWEQWNRNVQKISSKLHNVVAANNRYDQEYLHYFTGLGSKIELFPSYCGYVSDRYNPTRLEVLIAPARGVHRILSEEIFKQYENFKSNRRNVGLRRSVKNLSIAHIRELYPNHYEYSDLVAHPAVILLPYQVSFMSLFEMYRMAIPMFVPSVKLLSKWHFEHAVISERTWDRVFGNPKDRSLIERNTLTTSSYLSANRKNFKSDPNNEFSLEAIEEWISLADFYVWPFITTFDSWNDLFEKLSQASESDLKNISLSMSQYNIKEEESIHRKWKAVLDGIIIDKELRSSTKLPLNINDALESSYNYRLSDSCHGQVYMPNST